jgi:hypothetical protein
MGMGKVSSSSFKVDEEGGGCTCRRHSLERRKGARTQAEDAWRRLLPELLLSMWIADINMFAHEMRETIRRSSKWV